MEFGFNAVTLKILLPIFWTRLPPIPFIFLGTSPIPLSSFWVPPPIPLFNFIGVINIYG